MSAVASQCAILIVEDHVDTAEMLRRYLARKGFSALVANSGQEALEILSRQKPCCMIVDETMPGMTGLHLLRRLHDEPDCQDIPVFFYSAAFERHKQAEAHALGARGWFVKGISRLDELMDQVMAACAA